MKFLLGMTNNHGVTGNINYKDFWYFSGAAATYIEVAATYMSELQPHKFVFRTRFNGAK